MRTSIEYPGDGIVPFLSTAVPKLELQERLLVKLSCYSREFSPQSHIMILGEGVVANTVNDAGLADP